MSKRKEKPTIFRGKEYGMRIMRATIYLMASNEGKIKDKQQIEDRIFYIREKIKREMLMNKIMVTGIEDIMLIDTIPIHKTLTICLNPYYELAAVKSLKPFPVDIENPENVKWLSHFDTYLAMNLLYYRDNGKLLPNMEAFNYTNIEVIEAKEILTDYYDLENPRSNILESNQNLTYYHPMPNLIQAAERDVAEYEMGLVCKAMNSHEDLEGICKETGFDAEKNQAVPGCHCCQTKSEACRKSKSHPGSRNEVKSSHGQYKNPWLFLVQKSKFGQ